jgi:hypothetical protein
VVVVLLLLLLLLLLCGDIAAQRLRKSYHCEQADYTQICH